MMDAQRAFDTAVAGLYRAAAGEQEWQPALDPLAGLFGAQVVAIQHIDLEQQRLLALRASRNDALHDCVLQYVRHYHRVDPRRVRFLELSAAAPGAWVHDHELFDDRYAATDSFYQHFLAAYRLRFVSARLFTPAPQHAVSFAVEVSPQRGPLDADERELLRRLGEHLDEALRAHERVRRMQAQLLAGHRLMQDFGQPMWLVDADRYIRYANAAADDEIGRGRCALRRADRIVLVPQRLDAQLTVQLHALASRGHGASAVLALPAVSDHGPSWLHLSLLAPQQVVGAFGAQPVFLLTLFDPERVPAIDPFALTSLLDLTPAQARVASRLADGATPEQIAQAFGTTLATVRTHLRAVLDRVGLQRSDELVRVLHDGHALWGRSPRPA